MTRSRKARTSKKLSVINKSDDPICLQTLLRCSFVHAAVEDEVLHLRLELKSDPDQCEEQILSDFVEGSITCTSVSAESGNSPKADGCHKCGRSCDQKESIVRITLRAVEEMCKCANENLAGYSKCESDMPSGAETDEVGLKPVGVCEEAASDQDEILDQDQSDSEHSVAVSEEPTSGKEQNVPVKGKDDTCVTQTTKSAISQDVKSASSKMSLNSSETGRRKRRKCLITSQGSSEAIDSDSKPETQDSEGNCSDIEEGNTRKGKQRKGKLKPLINKRRTRSRPKTKVADSDDSVGREKKKKICATCGNDGNCDCLKQYKCKLCDKVFNHASNLRQHRASHTDARPFVCDVCGLGFKTRTNWKTHKSRHVKEYKCDICGREFSLAPALKYHTRTHTGERPFQCDTCGMTFTSTGGLRAHTRRHQVKEKTFKCELCDKAFRTKTNLETHIRIHQGVRPFPCPYCNLRFASRPHLNKHKRQHTKEKTFKCDFCSKAFFTQKLLDIHRSKHTGDKKYSCEVCGNKFTTSSTLKDHMLLHSDHKPFQCHICKKQFAANKTLKKHVQIHNTENPLVCEFCGKKCPAAKYLKSHMKMHLGYERHQCSICGKSYRDPRYLQIHMKSHTGEGLIQCEACGEHFADPMYLKLHQKKHCKARKEHCQICGQGFPNKNDLGLHLGLHTGERPFGCDTCGKAYTTAEACADHAKRHDFKMKSHQCSVCCKRFYTVNDLQRHTRRTQCSKGSRFNVLRKVVVKPVISSTILPADSDLGTELERSVATILPLPADDPMMTHSLPGTSGGLLTIDSSAIQTTRIDSHLSIIESTNVVSDSSMIESVSVVAHGLAADSTNTIDPTGISNLAMESSSHIQVPLCGPSLDTSISMAVNTVADGSSYIMYNMLPAGKHADK